MQRMPRCRRGYIHVVNNDYFEWKMYAIGGSANPTINSEGNRYTAPADPSAKEVTFLQFSGYIRFCMLYYLFLLLNKEEREPRRKRFGLMIKRKTNFIVDHCCVLMLAYCNHTKLLICLKTQHNR